MILVTTLSHAHNHRIATGYQKPSHTCMHYIHIINMYTYIYIYIHTHTYAYTMHVYVCIHISIYIYIYIHMYIHRIATGYQKPSRPTAPAGQGGNREV